MSIRNVAILLSMIALLAFALNSKVYAQSDSKSPAAKISDVSWIAGSWSGEAMGGRFEETWNTPSAGTMLGMFKFSKDDKVGFYEILTIVEKNDTLLLRLKHFTADLVGWEEKDKSVEFPLLSVSNREAKFDGLTFTKISDDEMHIAVVTKDKTGTQKIKFVAKRSKK